MCFERLRVSAILTPKGVLPISLRHDTINIELLAELLCDPTSEQMRALLSCGKLNRMARRARFDLLSLGTTHKSERQIKTMNDGLFITHHSQFIISSGGECLCLHEKIITHSTRFYRQLFCVSRFWLRLAARPGNRRIIPQSQLLRRLLLPAGTLKERSP